MIEIQSDKVEVVRGDCFNRCRVARLKAQDRKCQEAVMGRDNDSREGGSYERSGQGASGHPEEKTRAHQYCNQETVPSRTAYNRYGN
jgi:hypothetical protein